MKRQILSITFAFLFIGYLFGQDEKLDSSIFKSYNKALVRFYDTLAPSLFDKLSNKPIVRFVPKFSMGNGGSLISIEGDSLGKHKLIAHSYTFEKVLWHAKKTEIVESSIFISPEFSALIEKLFDTAINQIKDLEKPSFGLDGFTYYFLSVDSHGSQRIAYVWSPHRGSAIYRIVSICNDLTPIAEGYKKNIKKISRKINSLINELNE
jgi:hypothetical protein